MFFDSSGSRRKKVSPVCKHYYPQESLWTQGWDKTGCRAGCIVYLFCCPAAPSALKTPESVLSPVQNCEGFTQHWAKGASAGNYLSLKELRRKIRFSLMGCATVVMFKRRSFLLFGAGVVSAGFLMGFYQCWCEEMAFPADNIFDRVSWTLDLYQLKYILNPLVKNKSKTKLHGKDNFQRNMLYNIILPIMLLFFVTIWDFLLWF